MTGFVPRPVLTLAVGVIGHRPKRLTHPDQISFQFERLFGALEGVCAKVFRESAGMYRPHHDPAAPGAEPYRVRLVTGFAEGADQIAAAAAPASWMVEAILAGTRTQYEAAFEPALSSDGTDKRPALESALENTQKRIVELPMEVGGRAENSARRQRSLRQESYARQATFLLKQVDVLVAVWDGETADKIGGTGDTVLRSLKHGIPVVCISPDGERAPWLLLDPEDIEREGETPDALDGPLQDVLHALLRPPLEDSESLHHGWPPNDCATSLEKNRATAATGRHTPVS